MQHPRLARAARLWRDCCRCRRPTKEPRRGLCGRCYQDDYHGREPLERGCASCGQTDVRVLCRRTIGEAPAILCANCAAVLGRRPLTLERLRAEVLAAGGESARPRARVACLELVFETDPIPLEARGTDPYAHALAVRSIGHAQDDHLARIG